MEISKKEIKKIAIFRALQLGDMLCAIPAIRALRKAFPEANITLIGLPWAKTLCALYPQYFNDFIPFPGYPGLPEQAFDAIEFYGFLGKVQSEGFDLVLQIQGSGVISNAIVSLFNAKNIGGFYLKNHYRPNDSFFIEYPTGIHETERHLRLMEHLGIPQDGTELEFPVTEKDERALQELNLGLEKGKYVCVHPGSRSASRQWPAKYFAELADYCTDNSLTVVITGTTDELHLAKKVAANMKTSPIIVAGKTSLGSVAALVKNAAVLISNCTGVSHIAAALKVPSVIISMDGEPERWTPLNKNIHLAVDWTTRPEFDTVLSNLKQLLQHHVVQSFPEKPTA
jgi:ADP-heptose:LPS heptosyltransferase